MGRKKFIISLIILAAILAVGILNKDAARPSSTLVEAGSSHNVNGWAWSDTVGWISFNSKDCDSDEDGISDNDTDPTRYDCPIGQVISNYGVDIDSATGEFSGYAWVNPRDDDAGGGVGSDNIGWLSFESADVAGCPFVPPNGSCTATIDINTVSPTYNQVTGWARFLTPKNKPLEAGGWDGWVSLSCLNDGYCADSDYGLYRENCALINYAWGGYDESVKESAVGWIGFPDPIRGFTSYYVKTDFCDEELFIDLEARPSGDPSWYDFLEGGEGDLISVDLRAIMSGTVFWFKGYYKFDCENDGTYEHVSGLTGVSPYEAPAGLCSYPSAGTYTARVVINEGLYYEREDLLTIRVFAPDWSLNNPEDISVEFIGGLAKDSTKTTIIVNPLYGFSDDVDLYVMFIKKDGVDVKDDFTWIFDPTSLLTLGAYSSDFWLEQIPADIETGPYTITIKAISGVDIRTTSFQLNAESITPIFIEI